MMELSTNFKELDSKEAMETDGGCILWGLRYSSGWSSGGSGGGWSSGGSGGGWSSGGSGGGWSGSGGGWSSGGRW